ncbi:MAG: translesion DNA synthesis-associated protein ImuA, partial [Gammaproteobacteria bacterium]|nr:translesion DNA synthesis-associated protein ImuA [Gammaproteobacteria bacterium]
ALVQQRALWRARDFVSSKELTRTNLSTGYRVLDDVLYDGGWPTSGVVEILCDCYGIGELRLLTPALAKLSQQDTTWVVWINPPFVPYAPALDAEGISVHHLLLVYPHTHKEALWALEESMLSGSCKTIIAWLNEEELTAQEIRKIQTHARQNGVWVTLFRPQSAARQSSASELRLRLDPVVRNCGDTILVSILKRRGGWFLDDLKVELSTKPISCTLAKLESRIEEWRTQGIQ